MTRDLIEKLKLNLKGSLPGSEAQKLMAPSLRFTGEIYPDPGKSKSSGVLILLYPIKEVWYTVFIERTIYGPHGGQISLPGGKMEKTDPDIQATALREASEEIGVDISKIIILGQLTPLFVPHSNFNIFPVVAYQNESPLFRLNEEEVESIISIELDELFNNKNRGVKSFTSRGKTISAPYYKAKGHIVWGATAMIMSEFESLVKTIRED